MFVNRNKFKADNIYKKAFTLPEVIVATFISLLIVSFVFVFLTNIMEGISDTNDDVVVLSSIYDFTNKLNNYRNVYITGGILVDNTVGSDVFLMEDSSGETGILIGPVKLSDNKLNVNSLVYEDKGIGFRKVSPTEMIALKADVNEIYNYVFQKDQIFPDLKVQDLILINYNSGKIYDLNLILDLDFQVNLIGQQRQDLPKDNLKKFNIDF